MALGKISHYTAIINFSYHHAPTEPDGPHNPCGAFQPKRQNDSAEKILSPNFPANYPDKVDCSWLIEAEHVMQMIELSFDKFDTEEA